MPISIVVDRPICLGKGVWIADILPEELRLIGGSAKEHGGDVSILLLPEIEAPDAGTQLLRFSPYEARVLNVGRGTRTVIIFGGRSEEDDVEDEMVTRRIGPRGLQGDDAFLKEIEQMPRELRDLGEKLLQRVRKQFGGYFQRTSAGRYVNRPNNFWTVKVQPRDESYSITVRGYAHEYQGIKALQVKDDRRGYSRFKLSSPNQFEAAWSVVQKAGNR